MDDIAMADCEQNDEYAAIIHKKWKRNIYQAEIHNQTVEIEEFLKQIAKKSVKLVSQSHMLDQLDTEINAEENAFLTKWGPVSKTEAEVDFLKRQLQSEIESRQALEKQLNSRVSYAEELEQHLQEETQSRQVIENQLSCLRPLAEVGAAVRASKIDARLPTSYYYSIRHHFGDQSMILDAYLASFGGRAVADSVLYREDTENRRVDMLSYQQYYILSSGTVFEIYKLGQCETLLRILEMRGCLIEFVINSGGVYNFWIEDFNDYSKKIEHILNGKVAAKDLKLSITKIWRSSTFFERFVFEYGDLYPQLLLKLPVIR